jgi:hypothetical protein
MAMNAAGALLAVSKMKAESGSKKKGKKKSKKVAPDEEFE